MRNTLTLLWLRLLAFLLDYLFIAVYIGVLIGATLALAFSPIGRSFLHVWQDPNVSELVAFLLLVLPVLLYFALFEASHWQASWGKQKMGLIVTDKHGKRLSLGRSFVRSLLKFVPWELTHACLWRIPGWPLAVKEIPPLIELGLSLVWVIIGMYILSLLFNPSGQTLYDLLADAVVRKRVHADNSPAL